MRCWKKEGETFVSGGAGAGKGLFGGTGLTGGRRRQSRRLSRRGVRGRGGTFYLAMRGGRRGETHHRSGRWCVVSCLLLLLCVDRGYAALT